MKSSTQIMQAFLETAPYAKHLNMTDVAIAVCDREKYLGFFHGETLRFPVKAGDPIKRETVVYQSMQSGKPLSQRMGSELFGFPYIALATPVFENTEVVGGRGLSCFHRTPGAAASDGRNHCDGYGNP